MSFCPTLEVALQTLAALSSFEVPEVTVVLLDRVAKLPLPSHIIYIDEVSDVLASLTYTDHTNSEGTLPHRQV